MLRLTDVRTGRLAEVPASGRRLLRMCVRLPGPDTPVPVAALRTLLVGDLLMRTEEMAGGQVVHVRAAPGLLPERSKEIDRAVARFGIQPPLAAVPAGDEEQRALGGPADVQVAGGPRPEDGPGLWLEVREASSSVPLDGADPLAVRLVLLAHAYREQFRLTGQALAEAERTLAGWRGGVARWARSPSRPVPEDVAGVVRAALGSDLDLPRVVEVLRDVEGASGVPDGARFETFAFLDRVLGLELMREVGGG